MSRWMVKTTSFRSSSPSAFVNHSSQALINVDLSDGGLPMRHAVQRKPHPIHRLEHTLLCWYRVGYQVAMRPR
jgi:hypothetical protein